MVHPILDKYYERDPYHVRSSAFVQAKGLASNEKLPSNGSGSPAVDGPGFAANRSLSPNLCRRSLTPSSLREMRVPQQASTGHATSSPMDIPSRLAGAGTSVRS